MTAAPHTVVEDYLDGLLTRYGDDDSGAVADYIPQLAAADPTRFAIALSAVDGAVHSTGDDQCTFTIQSVSKPFVYALALHYLGREAVAETVDVEPSGDPFNELSLEAETGRPLNPMINAGALAVHGLLAPDDGAHLGGFARVHEGLSAFAGRPLGVDEAVYESELATAFRNRSLTNMLRSYDIVTGDPDQVLRGYTRQCAIEVTARDLAMMASTLANGGVQPLTGEQVISRPIVREVLSVMATCGMYDGAGDWLARVGIPAKSGVCGAIMGVLPGQAGLVTFSPRLDRHGNSVRGVQVFERISDEMGLHLMEVAPPARGAVRHEHVPETLGSRAAEVFWLQGSIHFAGAENLLRSVAELGPGEGKVVLDLTHAYSLNPVSQLFITQAARSAEEIGRDVEVIDPDGLLGGQDTAEDWTEPDWIEPDWVDPDWSESEGTDQVADPV